MPSKKAVVPRHVAIIMDGNNRWAKNASCRVLPDTKRASGGARGYRNRAEAGVEVLTLFAFSSENWKRPADEVSALMELFMAALRRSEQAGQNGIRLKVLGMRSAFIRIFRQRSALPSNRRQNNTHLFCRSPQLRWRRILRRLYASWPGRCVKEACNQGHNRDLITVT